MGIETGELLRFCRKRLRQLYPEMRSKPLTEWTRDELMRDAARGSPGVVRRAQAASFDEVMRFVFRDMGENMRHAPYVLQAWVDGVYFYYHGLDESGGLRWLTQHEGAKTYPSYFEAEAFILHNFDPNDARDSILVVPLREVEQCES